MLKNSSANYYQKKTKKGFKNEARERYQDLPEKEKNKK